MTFSIVAYDPNEAAWGVAVASKFLAVGAVVSWAQAGAGAVATQSYVRVRFGPDGLALLGEGKSAQETLDTLLAADPKQSIRQVGIVDAQGGAAAHTGADCFDWAGHRIGEGFTCQGNILAGAQVVEAMVEAYTGTRGSLTARLMAALSAGDEAGGDKRGRQSAAIRIAKMQDNLGGDNDRYLDLRVDDHPQPVLELRRLVDVHAIFFNRPAPHDLIPITPEIAHELKRMMLQGGYWTAEVNTLWDASAQQAFFTLIGNENLEERWLLERPDQIDRVALDYLRQRFWQGA